MLFIYFFFIQNISSISYLFSESYRFMNIKICIWGQQMEVTDGYYFS